jgi:urea transport system substrate-binding protein
MSIEAPENERFVDRWKAFLKANTLPDTDVTNDAIEATYVGIMMWAHAVQQAGSVEVDPVRKAMAGQAFRAPSGFEVRMDARNHHLQKPVFIGEIQQGGQFAILWKTDSLIPAEPWSSFLPENKARIAAEAH